QRVQGRASSSRWGKPSVGTNPGWTRATWTPWRCSSMDRASVQPARANLLAEYEPAPARDTRPATLPTNTIPLGAERRSRGSRASVIRTWASKLIAITRLTSAQPVRAKLPRPPTPALLTSRSRRPWSAPPPPGVLTQRAGAAVLALAPLGDQGGGRLLEQVGGDHGGPAELGGERLQPVDAPGDQHQAGARLGGEPPRRAPRAP